jgi:hypothetical protein
MMKDQWRSRKSDYPVKKLGLWNQSMDDVSVAAVLHDVAVN